MTDLEAMKLADAVERARDATPDRWTDERAALTRAAALIRRNSPTVEELVGYANHDDDCTVNRYPGTDACSCGLSAILQRVRHERTGE